MEKPITTDQPSQEEIIEHLHKIATGELPLQTIIETGEKKRLEQAATQDPLTGLLNRRGFEQKLIQLNKIQKRESHYSVEKKEYGEQGHALLVLDIDTFKLLNDTYGHDTGDEILKEVSAFLQSCFRPGDILCRWGGEEFVVLLEDTNVSQCVKRLHKSSTLNNQEAIGLSFPFTLREKTGDHKTVYRVPTVGEPLHDNEKELTLTISFSGGLVSFTPNKDKFEEKIVEADALLYKAKKSGRNNIQVENSAHSKEKSDGNVL
jgi:diguanylate cyclase (GGDEF)-like protein